MSQPESTPQATLPTWVEASLFKGMLRGIERECLRMQADGFIAQTDHPQALGSALTHPHITTDYSEALLEFITPPQTSIQKALNYLTDIHVVAYRGLAEDEHLWPMSMPCMLQNDEESIRLAQYGSSAIGRFKTLYRRGLGVRYGRRMQTIAGVHYNLSFPDSVFTALQAQETDETLKNLSLKDYRSHRYLGLIRNFIRLTPLVMFLLGASPTVNPCFMHGRDHHMLPLTRGTLYVPYSTALRMGNFGYQNSAQKQLGIQYNNLTDYLTGLQKAVKTPYPAFSRLGLDDETGEPLQINDHVLQIENEYYSLVRPKQVPEAGETPSQALANRGIGYVELRAVDINPYSPIGIDTHSAGFLETLAAYCLFKDSPELFEDELALIEKNQAEVVNRGRAENAAIVVDGQKQMIEAWAQNALDAMQPFAQLLDKTYNNTVYSQAMKVMQGRIDEVNDTFSAMLVGDTRDAGGMWPLGYSLLQEHEDFFNHYALSPEVEAHFAQLATLSVQQQQQLEQQSEIKFSDYLANYR